MADDLEVAWKNNPTLEDVSLCKVSLDPGVALRLSEALPTITNWKWFTLDSDTVTSEDAGHLLHAVANSSVGELLVSFISFCNMPTTALVQVLIKNVRLKSLRFWHCTLKASFLKRFSRTCFLAPQVEILDFSYCKLDDAFVVKITEALSNQPSALVNAGDLDLYFAYNSISVVGAFSLGLLVEKRKVKSLGIFGNDISVVGFKALFGSLGRADELNELYLNKPSDFPEKVFLQLVR